MKKFKYILLIAGFAGLFASCESDDEKYSGTPVGNQEIITLNGTISTPLTAALSNQKIPFTFEIPQAFKDTVTVEITTLNQSGSRTRISVDLLPNETSGTGEINASGGVVFNSTFDMYLSGIALRHTEPGKHYLLQSNRITLNTGSASVPEDDNSKFQLRFTWLNPGTTRNRLNLFIDRPNVSAFISALGASNSGTSITLTGSDTSTLQPGMVVAVSSGAGLFPAATIISEVTGPNTFTVNRAPTVGLGADTEITFGGNDYTSDNANTSGPVGTASNLVNVGSTAGLYIGMAVSVVGGTGSFSPGTTVSAIISDTQFRVSPTVGIANRLVDAQIKAAYPDYMPPTTTSYDHGISINAGSVSNNTSTGIGEYTFKFSVANLIESPTNLPYRIVWKFPDGSVGFRDGVYNNATPGAPSIPVIKVVKSGNGTGATFTILPE